MRWPEEEREKIGIESFFEGVGKLMQAFPAAWIWRVEVGVKGCRWEEVGRWVLEVEGEAGWRKGFVGRVVVL